NGTRQRISPLLRSIAVRCAYGGFNSGMPLWNVVPPPEPIRYRAFSSGTSFANAGEFVDRTNNTPLTGWYAPPPQFAPPTMPGRISVPSKLGGVNIGPMRYFFISACASAFNSGVRSNASSSVTPCSLNAGGFDGNGCVGHDCSPGTSLFGTARSSIGHVALPLARS